MLLREFNIEVKLFIKKMDESHTKEIALQSAEVYLAHEVCTAHARMRKDIPAKVKQLTNSVFSFSKNRAFNFASN